MGDIDFEEKFKEFLDRLDDAWTRGAPFYYYPWNRSFIRDILEFPEAAGAVSGVLVGGRLAGIPGAAAGGIIGYHIAAEAKRRREERAKPKQKTKPSPEAQHEEE